MVAGPVRRNAEDHGALGIETVLGWQVLDKKSSKQSNRNPSQGPS